MIGFRKKMTRLAILVSAIAAALAVSGLGASSAVAAPFCTPNEVNVVGAGASLQKKAQEIWTGRAVPSTAPVNTETATFETLPFAAGTNTGYKEACPAGNDPTVSYSSTGSGFGLNQFSFNGGALNTHIDYIGTDDPPTAGQITTAEGKSKTHPIIVPVTQTAIAVIVNPPANCDVTRISSADLNKVFGGVTITWSELENKTETVANACKSHITRVVRSDASGTTFQFKNHLASIKADGAGADPTCNTEGVLTTWAQLRPNEASGKPNISWPECGGTATAVVPKNGNSGVASHVAATAGTIGYAALPDAKNAGAQTVELQNGKVLGANTYAKPDAAESTSNCKNALYEVPVNGRWSEETTKGKAVDWSAVFGSNPTIGGATYPLCTLTFIVAWADYTEAGYGGGSAGIAEVVSDYVLHYVVSTAAGDGQADIAGTWHAALPVGNGATSNKNNVQDAAEFAAGKIGVTCETKAGGRFTSESDCFATKNIEPGAGSWERTYT